MSLAKAVLIILIFVPCYAQGNNYEEISKQLIPLIDQSDILILGEKHGREESAKLFTELVNYSTQKSNCLCVALEIDSDQQAAINRAMQGHGPLSEIAINPIIDHPAYREMLSALRGMVAGGRCLHVVAIDGFPNTIDRDAWMADVVAPYLDKGKVLCLLGRLHASKKIHWESGKHNPFLAERLVSKGYQVCSVQQLWGGAGGGVISPLTIWDVAEILEPVAAHMPEDAKDFGDYAIRWNDAAK